MKKIIAVSMFTVSLLCAQAQNALFTKHCAGCHAEIIGIDESGGDTTYICKAPHIEEVIKRLKEKTNTKAEFVSFIKDYINMPEKRKSLYGRRAVKEFGLMPTLSGALSDSESTELANYLYSGYGKKKEVVAKEVKKVKKKKKEEDIIFEKHCAGCHTEIMGIDESGGEITYIYKAPHIESVIKKLKQKTKSKAEFVSFIKDYINMPEKRKSLYGRRAVKKFGLMPSLNGVLSDEEETKLANSLYEKY